MVTVGSTKDDSEKSTAACEAVGNVLILRYRIYSNKNFQMTPLKFDDINFLPDQNNENILRAIAALGLKEKPIYVDITPDKDAVHGNCFLNVLKKVESTKGEMVLGWQFAEYSFMIEAEFHAVWKTPEGDLVDITPGVDPSAKKILFVTDKQKKFNGSRTNNFRFNTTGNPLIDDMIEIDHAKFRLEDKAHEVDAFGRVIFTDEQNIKWLELDFISRVIDNMCRYNSTVNSPCFCNSGREYNACHRRLIKLFLKEV